MVWGVALAALLSLPLGGFDVHEYDVCAGKNWNYLYYLF